MSRRPRTFRAIVAIVSLGLLGASVAYVPAFGTPPPADPPLVADPSSGPTPSDPTPSDPAPSGPAPSSSTPSAIQAPRVADTSDRQWPLHPPWDACPRPVWPGALSSGTPGGGRRVLVIGDSLTRDSRKLTAKALRASGWTPTFRCWGSKRLDWGISQVRRAKQLEQLPGYVVMALGTNDISWESTSTTQRRVQTLLDMIGPKRKVLWVDLDVDHSAFSHARAQWFNRMIRQVADGRANVTVIPWRRIARAEGAGRFDGIHYGAWGYRLRAKTVAARLDAAGRRDPAPATPSASPTPRPNPSATPTPGPAPTPTPTPTPSPAPAPTPSPTPTPTISPAFGLSSASS